MINLYVLTDALPSTLFGIFALWAAGSRRHWFVRLAVASAALLIILLIPAYEVLVEFALAMSFTVAGVTVWRWWRKRTAQISSTDISEPRPFRPQISLETVLLFMVVVAVTTAVAARVPHFDAQQWTFHIGVGVIMGCAALAAVWLVCARLPLWLRLVVAPFLLVLFVLAMRVLFVAQYLVYYWFNDPSSLSRYWQQVQQQGIWYGGQHWAIAFSLSLLLTCGWLALARVAGWFDPFHEADDCTAPQPVRTRFATIAGWGAIAFFILVSLFPLLLLYRLMTPTPIPDLSAPRPNGYDELIAAGRMIGETDYANLSKLVQLPDAQLRAFVAKNTEACQKAHQVLQGDCRFPLIGVKGGITFEEVQALYGLRDALYCRAKLASKGGPLDEQLSANLDLLRLSHFAHRSNGANEFDVVSPFEYESLQALSKCSTAMSADACLKLANELWQLDAKRPSWAQRIENQRAIDENSGWESHLRSILNEWSGQVWQGSGEEDLLRRTEMRILIASLAIRAFQLKKDRLPTSLAELTPEFLSAVPADPYDETQPLKYFVPGHAIVYSVGSDRVDNGGGPSADEPVMERHDVTSDLVFPELSKPAPAGRADASDGPDAAAGKKSPP